MYNILPLSEKFIKERFNEADTSNLVYHNIGHTFKVVSEVKELIRETRLGKEDEEILLTAAWFHDIGYLYSYEDHELKGCEIVKDFLSSHNYPDEKASVIYNCIIATRIPQSPRTLIEEILCDADYSHAGKEGFYPGSQLLRKEWEINRNLRLTDDEWLNKNISFLNSVHYFTQAAKNRYTVKKNENLAELLALAEPVK